jgi:hypothetical protein
MYMHDAADCNLINWEIRLHQLYSIFGNQRGGEGTPYFIHQVYIILQLHSSYLCTVRTYTHNIFLVRIRIILPTVAAAAALADKAAGAALAAVAAAAVTVPLLPLAAMTAAVALPTAAAVLVA